jgi:hypothetical protein
MYSNCAVLLLGVDDEFGHKNVEFPTICLEDLHKIIIDTFAAKAAVTLAAIASGDGIVTEQSLVGNDRHDFNVSSINSFMCLHHNALTK